MAVASVIVETEEGAVETVLNSLDIISQASVYGVKDNQIVVVVEGDDLRAVNEVIEHFCTIDKIMGVHSVFASDYA